MSNSGETVAEKMAEVVIDSLSQNLTNGTNETEKFKPTTEGLCLAYSSLLIMALIPIIIGSFKSVNHQKNQKESGEEIETMSTKEAMMFPVIASVTLFSIYLVFKFFHKDNINFLLACYFFILGAIALTRMST
jgi:minor histocompatibility antigen H13